MLVVDLPCYSVDLCLLSSVDWQLTGVVCVGGEGDYSDVKPSPVQDPRLVPQPTEGYQRWQILAGVVQRSRQQDS